MWFLCILIISVQLCHGILDGMTCKDVGAVKLRLEDEKEKRLLLQNDVEMLMLKVANLERKLEKDAGGSSSRSRNIAFMAYRDTSLTNIGLNDTVVFDTVVTNEGNGYSAITGIFTAPISGIYYFTWMTCHTRTVVSPVTDLVTGIVVNGEYKVHAAAVVASSFSMAGNSAVFRLDATDIVWIGVSQGNGSSSRSRNIAFMAYRDKSLTNIELIQKLVFDKVATNEGNGYSAITGIFTAPISGIYFFTWMTTHSKNIVSPDTDLVTGIVVNGEYKVHAAAVVTHGYFDMGGNSAVFRLNATDSVWIGVSHGNGMFSNLGAGWYYPSFSGFLIQP